MAGSDLSPRAATIVGLIFVVLGLFPILGALKIIHLPVSEAVPTWVRIAAGLTFVLGGAMVIIGYAIAGVELDDADAEAGPYGIHVPLGVRVTQYLLAVVIYGLFAAIAGWVALGHGQRSAWGSPWVERAAFGAGAVLVAAAGVAVAVRNFGRLKRP